MASERDTADQEHANAWLSYDTVADAYERVAVPWFTPLARDLIQAVALLPGATVLDIGTGTGLVSGIARTVVGGGGVVVGVDPSIAMLRQARTSRGLQVVAGVAPGLPLRDESVDTVVANLVLSHLLDLHAGLTDMARVVRAGGRIGATAWGPIEPATDNNQQPAANALVASVSEACGLPTSTPCHGAPNEDALRDPTYLQTALAEAGLTDCAAHLHTYRATFKIDNYLVGWGSLGRYQRAVVGEQRWTDFREHAAAKLHERFGHTVTSINHVWITTARKPVSA